MNEDLAAFAREQQGQIGPHGMIEVFRKTRTAIGWDPASTTGPDDSAVVVVESVREPVEPKDNTDWFDAKTMSQRLGPQILYVRKAVIMPRGTSYPEQWKIVREIYDRANRQGKTPELWVDATGLGSAIPALGGAVGLYPERIKITSGGEVSRAHGDWHIPKSILAGLLVAHIHDSALKFPDPAKDATIKALLGQLGTFVANTTAAGSATYAAQGSAKDDLVLATSYAVFAISEKRGRSRFSVQQIVI